MISWMIAPDENLIHRWGTSLMFVKITFLSDHHDRPHLVTFTSLCKNLNYRCELESRGHGLFSSVWIDRSTSLKYCNSGTILVTWKLVVLFCTILWTISFDVLTLTLPSHIVIDRFTVVGFFSITYVQSNSLLKLVSEIETV